jgi:hypothetical protein
MNGNLVKSAQIEREELMRPASSCFPRGKQQDDGVLVVQDDTEEGAVHVHLAVVVNEAPFLELIQKDTDSRPLENPGQWNSYRQCCPLAF